MKSQRLSRAEKAAIIITLVLAALVVGYHFGSRDVRTDAHMTVSPLEYTTADSIADEDETQPAADTEPKLININTASEAELLLLPGIGEARARSIVEYREENGPFEKIENPDPLTELKQIKIKAR